MLEFNEERHEYRWNGVIVPSVTQILKPLTDFSRISPAILEHARQQGVAIHKMVELELAGDLDISSLPEWMLPYYTAWGKFVAETGFECVASEQQVYHNKLGYAGTVDLVGAMRGAGGLALLDIKRSLSAGAVIGLQLSGYAQAWDSQDIPGRAHVIKHRYALQLIQNGTYKLEPFNDPSDSSAFLACLTMHRWREKHQPKGEKK
ncbi:MAG: hypothetical protein ACYC36_03765 [Bellilinea sp.]